VFNAAPHTRSDVPFGGAAVAGAFTGTPVEVSETPAGFVLFNGLIRVVVDACGLVTSVHDIAADREVLAGPANLLQLHPDFPNMWDAWDVDSFYRNSVTDLTTVDSMALGVRDPDRVAVRINRSFSRSTVTQLVALRAGSTRLEINTDVDWHETEKFLKLAFPLDVRADRSAAEIQFGHVLRPTHTNTSWDAAKFEICAHRWLHLAEPGLRSRPHQRLHLRPRLHPYRSHHHGPSVAPTRPTVPGPAYGPRSAQIPPHLVAGASIPDAVREGYRVNLPVRTVTGSRPWRPWWPWTTRMWWWRRSSSPTTGPVTWSSGCTRPPAVGPVPGWAPA
jgi:alpha-mannosidase